MHLPLKYKTVYGVETFWESSEAVGVWVRFVALGLQCLADEWTIISFSFNRISSETNAWPTCEFIQQMVFDVLCLYLHLLAVLLLHEDIGEGKLWLLAASIPVICVSSWLAVLHSLSQLLAALWLEGSSRRQCRPWQLGWGGQRSAQLLLLLCSFTFALPLLACSAWKGAASIRRDEMEVVGRATHGKKPGS